VDIFFFARNILSSRFASGVLRYRGVARFWPSICLQGRSWRCWQSTFCWFTF
jgi:hypothetical protein